MQVSLRLERMGLTDREAGMLAEWCERQGPGLCISKLWLFDDALGDEGARHVARMLHPGMLEVGRGGGLALAPPPAAAHLQRLPH